MEKWKIIDQEYIIRRPWLTARRDKVQLPDGTVLDEYYVLEYPTWINVIAITKDNRFVMVEQYRHGLQDIFIELVAGVVEKGEDPLEGAKRELLEETGFGGGKWRLNTVLSANPSTMTNLTYSYIAEGVELKSAQHLDDTEDINVKILSEDEVRQLLRDDKIKQSLMAASLLRYFSKI